ncbi:MAG: hypothetical protein MJ032_01510, partial [Acidaminococcaceae bacterium]|nr:hypothetical protein [Acidaminococcaceae bacterium]
MKINLKNKIMLAILAGNVLCMSSAWAANIYWYGDKNNPTQWKSYTGSEFAPIGACMSGATLTLDENTVVDGKYVGDVRGFYGGYSRTGTVSNNSITINGGSMGDVYSGYSGTGKVINNIVSINDGKVGK